MNTIRTPANELDLLRGQKGHTCISIIVSTHKQQDDQRTDELYVQQAVHRATDVVRLWYPEEAPSLVESLRTLQQALDYQHNQEGLGLYVSDDVQLIVQFPFPVTRKIAVSKRFETKELIYKAAYSFPYYVLFLEDEKASLYFGVLQHLEEVTDQNFPCMAVDDYDYQHPVHRLSFTSQAHLKHFEEDKTEFQKVRYHAFLTKVDDLLNDYLTGDTRMIVCGARRNTAAFMNQSPHDAQVMSVLNDNVSKLNPKDLSDLIYPIILAFLEEKMQDEIDRLEELAGQGLVEEGFFQVRQAITEGRGAKLLIEQEYPYAEIIDPEKSMHPLPVPHGIAGAHAVEDLVDMLLDKKGQVLPVEKDMLKAYSHIALITKY